LQQFADDAIENIRERFSKEELNEDQAEIVRILSRILPSLIRHNTLIAKLDEENDAVKIDFYDRNLHLAALDREGSINKIASIRMKADGKERTKDQKEIIRQDNIEDLEQSIKTLFYSHANTTMGDINFLDLPIFKPLDALRVLETVTMDFNYFNNLKQAKN
jgi:hypothetical protein